MLFDIGLIIFEGVYLQKQKQIRQMELHQIKGLCTVKKTIIKMKTPITEWEKILKKLKNRTN